MRIIKQGLTKEMLEKLTEQHEACSNCKCEFAYTPDETKTDRDGDYVICPCCGTFIQVSKHSYGKK